MLKDLGVLFVHGIGEQPRGQTLLESGDPIIQWLNRWVARGDKEAAGLVEVISTKLDAAPDDDTLPAYAEIRVRAPGVEAEQRWLFAESWWGAAVRPPAFGKLAAWLMTVGAWTILSHTMKRLAGRRGAWAETLRVVSFIGGIIAAVGLQLVVLLLATLATLPIPPLRRALARALLGITGSLGDAYVLVQSGLQRSALVQRTRESLEWLANRCSRVCVIAHSQGAAIAHLVLRDAVPPNMAAFISYGSGLGKLEELLSAKEAGGRVQLIARSGPILIFAFALLTYMALFNPMDDWGTAALFIVGSMALITFLYAFKTCREFWNDSGLRLQALALTSAPAEMIWVDIHASHDPVSNGPLSPFEETVPGLASIRVENTRNWFTDHTAYWRNGAEFVPHVAYVLNDAARTGVFTGGENDVALQQVTLAHRSALRWFQATRVATFLGGVVLLPLYWDELLLFGQNVQSILATAGGFLGGLRDEIATIGKAFAALIPGYSADVATRVLGAAVPITLMMAWRSGYAFVWRWWDGLPMKQVLESRVVHPVDKLVTDAFVIMLGMLPLVLVFVYPVLEELVISRVITGLALVFLGPLYVYGLGRAVVTNVRERLRSKPGSRLMEEGEWGALVAAAVGVFFIASLLIPAVKDAMMGLLIFAMMAAFAYRLQNGLNGRMAELTTSRWRYVVTAFPATVSAALYAVIILARRGTQYSFTWGQLPDAFFTWIGLFVLMTLLTRGAIWLATRTIFKRQVASAT